MLFGDLPDPRGHNVIHKLHDILVIAICAVVCGANGWAEVEQFGNSKQSWFRTLFWICPVASPVMTHSGVFLPGSVPMPSNAALSLGRVRCRRSAAGS